MPDNKNACWIDVDSRTVTIPKDVYLGVEHDKDVNTIHFEMSKIYQNIDLSTFSVSIYYENEDKYKDIYIIEDISIADNKMSFSWLVGASACASPGTVDFVIKFRKYDEEGRVLNEYNTKTATMKVLEGCDDPNEDQAYREFMADIVAQLEMQINDLRNKLNTISGITIDKTLKVSNAAADAKATGDALDSISTALDGMSQTITDLTNECESLHSADQELNLRITSLSEAIDNLKKSVSDGKLKVASAITEKGVSTEATDTFDVMATNILQIDTGGDAVKVTTSPVMHGATLNELIKTRISHQKALVESDGTVIGEDGTVIIGGRYHVD